MKTRLIILGLLVVVALATTSTAVAYRIGYRHGGDAERACWALDPAPSDAWLHGEITARRNAVKHPFVQRGRLDVRADRTVNSVPVTPSR
jgi:hypothetical protein